MNQGPGIRLTSVNGAISMAIMGGTWPCHASALEIFRLPELNGAIGSNRLQLDALRETKNS